MNRHFRIEGVQSAIAIGNAHYATVEAGWSYMLHSHQTYELLHCRKGRVTEWINGEAVELATGGWLLIAPGARHSTINHSREPFAYLSVHFTLDHADFRQGLRHLNYFHLKESVPKLDGLFEELAEWGLAGQTGSESIENAAPRNTAIASFLHQLRYQTLFLAMLEEVLLRFLQTPDALQPGRKKLPVAEIELARRIELQLNEAAFRGIAVQDVASRLYISRSHCNETFKKVYGISPRQYISLLILNKAKELILHSGLSMEEIGGRLGFSGLSAFSRQFRRWTGMSPVRYRDDLMSSGVKNSSSPR